MSRHPEQRRPMTIEGSQWPSSPPPPPPPPPPPDAGSARRPGGRGPKSGSPPSNRPTSTSSCDNMRVGDHRALDGGFTDCCVIKQRLRRQHPIPGSSVARESERHDDTAKLRRWRWSSLHLDSSSISADVADGTLRKGPIMKRRGSPHCDPTPSRAIAALAADDDAVICRQGRACSSD